MAQDFTSAGTAAAPNGATLLTELDAINTMLEVIGEAPVSSINLALPDVATAKSILDGALRDVQTIGLNSNTDDYYELTPTGADPGPAGEFTIPTDPYPVLRIDAFNPYRHVVKRGLKLWDKDNHTYIFTETSLRVNIVWLLPFADLPTSTRVYITMKAAAQFHARVLGSEALSPYAEKDERTAYALFQAEELCTGQYSMLNSPGLYNLRRR
jgi:hypothetical protein